MLFESVAPAAASTPSLAVAAAPAASAAKLAVKLHMVVTQTFNRVLEL